MNSFDSENFSAQINRRSFLYRSAFGLGGIALAQFVPSLARAAAEASAESKWRGVIAQPHFPVKAKRIIHLCMAGGPSQFDSFDWKPELKKLNGQPFPDSLTKGQ